MPENLSINLTDYIGKNAFNAARIRAEFTDIARTRFAYRQFTFVSRLLVQTSVYVLKGKAAYGHNPKYLIYRCRVPDHMIRNHVRPLLVPQHTPFLAPMPYHYKQLVSHAKLNHL